MTASRLNQTFCSKGPERLIVTNNQAAFLNTSGKRNQKQTAWKKKLQRQSGSQHLTVKTHCERQTTAKPRESARHWQISDHTHYSTTHNAPANTKPVIRHRHQYPKDKAQGFIAEVTTSFAAQYNSKADKSTFQH